MPSRYANLHRRGQKYYFFWRDEKGRRREESLRTSDTRLPNNGIDCGPRKSGMGGHPMI